MPNEPQGTKHVFPEKSSDIQLKLVIKVCLQMGLKISGEKRASNSTTRKRKMNLHSHMDICGEKK